MALFYLIGLFGGVDTLLDFLFKCFGCKLLNRGEEKVVHIIEDVTILGVIVSGVKVGEKGLAFFEEQGFGFVAGGGVMAFIELPCQKDFTTL